MTGTARSGRDSPAAAVTAPPLWAAGAAALPAGGSSGPACPCSAAALGRPVPGRVSRRAPASSPRPEQRPGRGAPGAPAGQWRVSGGFAPAPVLLWCPASPGQPRCRRSRGLPVPLAARGSAPGPRHGASARSGRARPEPRPPERDLLRLTHTGGSPGAPAASPHLGLLGAPHRHRPTGSLRVRGFACTWR